MIENDLSLAEIAHVNGSVYFVQNWDYEGKVVVVDITNITNIFIAKEYGNLAIDYTYYYLYFVILVNVPQAQVVKRILQGPTGIFYSGGSDVIQTNNIAIFNSNSSSSSPAGQ